MKFSRQIKPTRETMALLKILALGVQEIAQGKVRPAADVIKGLRNKVSAH